MKTVKVDDLKNFPLMLSEIQKRTHFYA